MKTIIIITLIALINIISLSFSQNSEDYPIFIQYENRSLRGDGIERINESNAQEIANSIFNEKIPIEFKDSLVLEDIEKIYHFYIFSWKRYINNIPATKEGFVAWIDYSNGNVVLWSLNLGYPASQIDVTPALTKNMALFTIEKAYNIEPQSSGPYGPYLSIEGKRAVWSVYLPDNSIVTIDAETGETIRFSPTKDGSIYNPTSTKFNPTQYYLDVYGKYAIIFILITGLAFWKRSQLIKLLKR